MSSPRDILINILTRGDSSGVQDVSGSLDRMGETADRVGRKLSLAVTAPLVGLGAVSVKFAADAAESADKLQAVFGPATDTVNQKIAALRDTIPATTAELQDLFSGIQDLLVPLGMAPAEAQEMSTSIVELAGDLASFNNIPVADALARIRSGLVGQYEPLLQFGVALNATTVKAKAFEQGIGDGKRELTAAERAQVSYQLILEGTTAAHGNAADTAESAANQLKFLRKESVELATGIGERLLPAVTSMVSGLRGAVDAAEALPDPVVNIGLALAGMAAATGPALVGTSMLIKSIRTLTPAGAGLTVALGFTTTALIGLASAYQGAVDATDDLSASQTNLSRSLVNDLKAADSADDLTAVIRQSSSALAAVQGELNTINAEIAAASSRNQGRIRADFQERIDFLETEKGILERNISIAQGQGAEIVEQNQARAEALALAQEEAIAAETKAISEAAAAEQLERQKEARETALEDIDLELQILDAKLAKDTERVKALEDQKREQVIINQLQKLGVTLAEAEAKAEELVSKQRRVREQQKTGGNDGNNDLRTRLGLLDQVGAKENQQRQLKAGVRSDDYFDFDGTKKTRYFEGGRVIDESEAFQGPAPQASAPQAPTQQPPAPRSPQGGVGTQPQPQAAATAPVEQALAGVVLDLSPLVAAIQSMQARLQSQIDNNASRIEELGS